MARAHVAVLIALAAASGAAHADRARRPAAPGWRPPPGPSPVASGPIDPAVPDPRPWLGISYDPTIGGGGLAVTNVFEDSGASAAGLRAGDEIIEIDGEVIFAGSDLSPIIGTRSIGDRLTVRVLRQENRALSEEDRADRQARLSLFGELSEPFGYRVVTLHPVLTERVGESELLHRQLVGKRAHAFSLVRPEDPDGPPIEDSVLNDKVGVMVWFRPTCLDCFAIASAIAPWVDAHAQEAVGLAGTSGEPQMLASVLTTREVALPIGVDDDATVAYTTVGDRANAIVVVVDRDGIVRMAASIASAEDPALDDVLAAATAALQKRATRR